jgi:hypothetical protein
MADEQSGPPNKRRRPPTTIDLKATEVASGRSSPAQPIDPAPKSERAEKVAEPVAKPTPEPAPSSGERPRAGGWRDRIDLSGVNARMEALRGRVGERVNSRAIAACGAGAAVLALLLLALWGAGAFRSDDRNAARIARLEQHVVALANRPEPPAVDPRTLTELAARLTAAEQAAGRVADLDARLAKAEAAASAAAAAPRGAQPDPALTARVTALEAAVRQGIDAASASARDAKSRADAAFELAQKAPAQAPTVAPAELQALAARVTTLEQAAKALEGRVAVTAGADRAGRLAFVAVALRGAVERGEP